MKIIFFCFLIDFDKEGKI